MPQFDMRPVEVPQDVLDGLKALPTATVYSAVRQFGSPFNVCEGLVNLTPGTRLAARARTLRFLPIRADLISERPAGEHSTEYVAMGTLRTRRRTGGGHLRRAKGRGPPETSSCFSLP